uniref:Uncharacterized protein n=1 Tax=Trichogramma kaykai TaxID=54128 RepID=A0ABD2WGQ9_9HYME
MRLFRRSTPPTKHFGSRSRFYLYIYVRKTDDANVSARIKWISRGDSSWWCATQLRTILFALILFPCMYDLRVSIQMCSQIRECIATATGATSYPLPYIAYTLPQKRSYSTRSWLQGIFSLAVDEYRSSPRVDEYYPHPRYLSCVRDRNGAIGPNLMSQRGQAQYVTADENCTSLNIKQEMLHASYSCSTANLISCYEFTLSARKHILSKQSDALHTEEICSSIERFYSSSSE